MSNLLYKICKLRTLLKGKNIMGKVIGIDLGTTNSCCSVVENNEPVIVPSASGATTTPSVVAFTKNGERLVGEKAKRQAVTNPGRTVTSIKREMGTNWSMRVDGVEYKPQTISAMILQQLRADAEKFLGETVTDAVITVPAYFNDSQRQATKDAGRIAGLTVLRIINEPTSAALSYGLDHGESQKVMVYDLGGGTFDVSIIEIDDGVIEVLATSGNNHLGGDDFDARVRNWIQDNIKEQFGVDVSKDLAVMERITEAAEQAKKELSTSDSTEIMMPYLTKVHGEMVNLDLTLTRSKFEDLIGDLVMMTEGPVQQALRDAKISASQLGRVLLVGGSTRIPMVQQKVKQLTGKEPSKNINPDECVAKGAAILGSQLGGNALIPAGGDKEMLLLDVTPLGLSIETVGGVATRLVERNTTLPTRYSQIFTTAAPYQTSVEIKVLQGDRPMARDNKLIGEFRLNGIKRAPAGVPQIEVTFDIDANGILKVSAKDLDTGKEQSITITANDRMSESEIQQAMIEAQRYAGDDAQRTEALELINECQATINEANTRLNAAGKDVDRSVKKQVKNSLNALEKKVTKCRVDKITDQEINDIRAAKAALEGDMSMLPEQGT